MDSLLLATPTDSGWELATQLISSTLVLAGIIITIVHFNRSQLNQMKAVEQQLSFQRNEQDEANRNGFQKAFWEKQLDLYIRASSGAARLTQCDPASEEFRQVYSEFYTLFWGPMSIVEDQEVKSAMENFSFRLQRYEAKDSETGLQELKKASYYLAKTCRESAIKRWDLKEFELEERERPTNGNLIAAL